MKKRIVDFIKKHRIKVLSGVVLVVVSCVVVVLLTRKSADSNNNNNGGGDNNNNNEGDSAVLNERFHGCPNTGPEKWVPSYYTVLGDCNLTGAEALFKQNGTFFDKKKYKKVFSQSGKQIYEDLFGDQQYWLNYGNYTTLSNSSFTCKPEPTSSKVRYDQLYGPNGKRTPTLAYDSEKLMIKSLPQTDGIRLSARIHSKVSFIYGIHAWKITDIPSNKVVWPAAWQVAPYNCKREREEGDSEALFGRWPASGETDVFEKMVWNDNVFSSMHMSCRNDDEALTLCGDMGNEPGWYAVLWTPLYMKVYYVPIQEGGIFEREELTEADLEYYNKTKSSKKGNGKSILWDGVNLNDSGGMDVTSKKVSIDWRGAEDNRDKWIVAGDNVKEVGCQKNENNNIAKGDNAYENRHKYQFISHREAFRTGGFVAVMNVATSQKYPPDNIDTNTEEKLGIGAYKVWQIIDV